MESIINYVKPELLVAVIALYYVGKILKDSNKVKDTLIPATLGGLGVLLSLIWVFATTTITNYQSVLMALFTAITQGIIIAGLSVYANQIIKQYKKDE